MGKRRSLIVFGWTSISPTHELNVSRSNRCLVVFITACFFGELIFAEPTISSHVLLSDFGKGWEQVWKIKRLGQRPNRFTVTQENGNRALSVQSADSASGMFRKWPLEPDSSARISWLWKVSRALTENKSERSKKGDDYAARMFVLFEPHFFHWRIPTVCYVWAGNEPVGSVFLSPYSDRVCMIVLQSGNASARQWIREERNYFADYTRCFGKNPRKVSAVAVMVDTDNTRAQTAAWFDDLAIR